MTTTQKMSSTVLKAFAILDLVASKEDRGISLTTVSEELGTSVSTAHRYLITLETLGAVERDDSGRFLLGTKLIELAGAYLRDHSLQGASEPFLDQLAQETGETAHLAVPSGGEVVYIAKIDSKHSVQMSSKIGGRMPMCCTALGKSILAHSSDRLDKTVRGGLEPRTPHTLTSPEALREELEEVRAKGYAIDNEENELGVRCVGAPVFDHRGRVVGAISVSGPSSRVSRKQAVNWGPLVRETALKISRRMGYPERE